MFDPGTGGSLEMEAPDTTAGAIHMDGSFDVAHVAPGAHCVMVQGSFGLARRVMMSPSGLNWPFLTAAVNAAGSFVLEGAFPLAYTVSLQMPEGSYIKTVGLGCQVPAGGRIQLTSGAGPMTILLATPAT